MRAEARAQAREALATVAGRWPRPLLPLGALTVLARIDADAPGQRAQGAPKRLLRLLALRISGR